MTDEEVNDEIIGSAGLEWARTRSTMKGYLNLVIKYTRQHEREACARVCETIERKTKTAEKLAESLIAADCAEAIRARGEK